MKNSQYRFNPLTLSAISWIGAAFLILSSSHYSPPRYMMIFCVPIAIIVPLITDFIFNTAQKKITRKVVIGILLLSLAIIETNLSKYYDVQLLKTYEVYNNSDQNKPVILYQLRPF